MVGTFGHFDLLREITGQFNFEAAGKSGFPCDQLSVVSVPAILPALYEGCVDSILAPSRCFHRFQLASQTWWRTAGSIHSSSLLRMSR